jgi:hypothetical protein
VGEPRATLPADQPERRLEDLGAATLTAIVDHR